LLLAAEPQLRVLLQGRADEVCVDKSGEESDEGWREKFRRLKELQTAGYSLEARKYIQLLRDWQRAIIFYRKFHVNHAVCLRASLGEENMRLDLKSRS
jgi:hypothetical protein